MIRSSILFIQKSKEIASAIQKMTTNNRVQYTTNVIYIKAYFLTKKKMLHTKIAKKMGKTMRRTTKEKSSNITASHTLIAVVMRVTT
jgi:hypothetical protein